MAWTAPMTAASNATFTAAEWNSHIRDNLNETEVAKASTLHNYFVSTGANAITTRKSVSDYTSGIVTTTSTSYSTLSGSPTVSVSTGANAIVWISAGMANATTGASCMVSFAVSGATTVASSDDWMIAADGMHGWSNPYEPYDEHVRRGVAKLVTGLTPGTNTFTMQCKVGSGTGRFNNRDLVVLPL